MTGASAIIVAVAAGVQLWRSRRSADLAVGAFLLVVIVSLISGLHWSEYSAKAIALIQARGMPIDMAMWNAVQENKGAVIGELLRRLDPSHSSPFPIFSDDGEWSYQRLEEWLAYAGVPAWPRRQS